jgi:CDGSH-type Zn-finger protein
MADWAKAPHKIEVTEGQVLAFCTCGKSANIFCNGSHAGTDKTPEVIKFTENKTIYACTCLQSANHPYCDGSHKNA